MSSLVPQNSPRQAAKQKRDFIYNVLSKGIYNKNSPDLPGGREEYDKLPEHSYFVNGGLVKRIVNLYDKQTIPTKVIYKIVKYECACGESNYANCPFIEKSLAYHIISTLGKLYDVYMETRDSNRKMYHCTIFVCVLCKKFISVLPPNSVNVCCKHLGKHFMPKNRNFNRISNPWGVDADIFILFYNANIQNVRNQTNIRLLNPPTILEYQQYLNKLATVQCKICRKICVSQNCYDLLYHANECSTNFMNSAKIVWDEKQFMACAFSTILFFAKTRIREKLNVQKIEYYRTTIIFAMNHTKYEIMRARISPQQAAKQKRKLIEFAEKKYIFNKNSPLLPAASKEFEKLPSIGYRKNNSNRYVVLYKLVKYECVCGESNYADCHFTGQRLDLHVISTFGELYTIYTDPYEMDKNNKFIFACVLCKNHISFLTASKIVDDSCFHMNTHFSQNGNYNEYNNFWVIPMKNEIFFSLYRTGLGEMEISKISSLTHETLFQYMIEADKYKPLHCSICAMVYVSHNNYELLFHSYICSTNFINNSKITWKEYELKNRMVDTVFFFY